MPTKNKPTGQKQWFLHLVVFLIANAIMWFFTYNGKMDEPFVYPWPAWITAAWGLLVIGHACLVWYDYKDANYEEWQRQTKN